MNKYMMIMGIILYDVIITLTVGALTGFGTSTDIFTGANPIDPTPLGFLGAIFEIVPFFFKIVFFSVEGLPAVIPLLFFYPINIAMLFLVIALIRGTD